MREIVDQSTADRKLTMNLLVAFALLALVLASLGVYSVMAYSVAQRTDEIGVRMALGASAESVQKMVLRQGMTLAGVGLAIGLAAALALTRLMAAMLFDVAANDPLVYTTIAALLALVAALACWLPSRRAARASAQEIGERASAALNGHKRRVLHLPRSRAGKLAVGTLAAAALAGGTLAAVDREAGN